LLLSGESDHSKRLLEGLPYYMSIDANETPASVATHTIYLALGSNLGDRRGNLAAALQQLRDIMDISAVGYIDQPNFFNMVCSGKTGLPVQDFLVHAKAIEASLGRQVTFRNGPRPIDIDILFYDDLNTTQGDVTVPHPRMAERAFVLVPLAEIAPDKVDPRSGQTVMELLNSVSRDGVTNIAPNLRISLDQT
jgi:GTP cyclohydrolase-4